MTFKILTAVVLAAVVGLASATSSTEEVRMLEAKLFAAKAKFAAEQNVHSDVNHSERGARADTRYVFFFCDADKRNTGSCAFQHVPTQTVCAHE